MNLIEHYIIEIHSETFLPNVKDFIEVDLTYNCYGSVERNLYMFHVDAWKEAKEKGYFLA